jgi:hypothetical protein
VIDGRRTGCGIRVKTSALDFLDFLEKLYVDALFVVDPAGGIRAGDNLGAHLLSLLYRVNRNVSGAGNTDGFA